MPKKFIKSLFDLIYKIIKHQVVKECKIYSYLSDFKPNC